MKLHTLRERLIRRLSVNYVAYMGQKEVTAEWLEGYFQAKKDAEREGSISNHLAVNEEQKVTLIYIN